MAGLTKAAQDNILGLMRGTAWPAGTGGWGVTPQASCYIGLYTANPSTDATVSPTGTEVTGGGYLRVAFANANWSAITTVGTASHIDNGTNVITFATPSASWGTVTGIGVFDASSAGNLLWWAPLGSSQAIGTGVVASFAASALVMTVD